MAKGRIQYERGKTPRYFLDGAEVTAEEYDAAFPSKFQQLLDSRDSLVADTREAWPLVSDALGVHPDQVDEANRRNKTAGVNVTYNRKGQAVLPNRNERRKLMRLEGVHDRDGGYGD